MSLDFVKYFTNFGEILHVQTFCPLDLLDINFLYLPIYITKTNAVNNEMLARLSDHEHQNGYSNMTYGYNVVLKFLKN